MNWAKEFNDVHQMFVRRAAVFGIIVLLLGAGVIHSVYTDPAMMRPFLGVVGENPLGIPTRIAALALISAMLTPLLMMMWHGMALATRLRELGGRPAFGAVGLLLGARRHWSSPEVRYHLWRTLRWFVGFVVVTAVWILATAIAGV